MFLASSLWRITKGLVLLVIGLTPLTLEFYWWQALYASVWPQTEATVLDGDGRLRYAYQWKGVRYEHSGYTFGDAFVEEHSPRKLEFLATHKPGNRITVFLNPFDATDAIVDRSMGGDPYSLAFDLFFVATFSLPGVKMIYSGLRGIRGYGFSGH